MNLIHDNEENILKGIKTEPKKLSRNFFSFKQNRKPLGTINENNPISNTFELKKDQDKITLSEPINIFKSKSRILPKILKSEEIQKTPNSKKHALKLNAAKLAIILDYDTFIEEELGADESDELKLFKFLETEGNLSPEILKHFSKCPTIRNISMTKSYADVVKESGLQSIGKYSVILCTKPFYYGFQNILSLDFTNVKLGDDELRYLIRLPKLQALGLSGSLITDKGLKYLSVHASFKGSLRCLKLCFIQGITDFCFQSLIFFTKLRNLDLRGSEHITVIGCHNLFDETIKAPVSTIKLPQKIMEKLMETSEFYKSLSKNNTFIILDSKDVRIDNLNISELKAQLDLHKQIYPNIYLNQNTNDLREKLENILRIRKKEENILKCCFN